VKNVAERWFKAPQLGQRLGGIPHSSSNIPFMSGGIVAELDVRDFPSRRWPVFLQFSAYHIQRSKRIAYRLPFFWGASVIHQQFLKSAVYRGFRGLNAQRILFASRIRFSSSVAGGLHPVRSLDPLPRKTTQLAMCNIDCIINRNVVGGRKKLRLFLPLICAD
jgi:hypothetical protein